MTTQEQWHVRDKENVSLNTTGKNFIIKLQRVLCIYNLQDFTISESLKSIIQISKKKTIQNLKHVSI